MHGAEADGLYEEEGVGRGNLTYASIRECKYWVMIECTYKTVLGFDRYEEGGRNAIIGYKDGLNHLAV